jgi:hypothetical protein
MRCYESLINDLRGGDHQKRPTVLGGVTHDERCLEAADEIEKLKKYLAAAITLIAVCHDHEITMGELISKANPTTEEAPCSQL